MFHQPTPARPPRACTTCKKRKRACDKQIPTCSSCIWLQTCCVYEIPLPSALPSKEPHISPSSLYSNKGQYTISTAIQNQAVALFGDSCSIETTIQTFFTRIHPWLPFLSRQRFEHLLPSLSSYQEDHSPSLLPCVMYLVVEIPAGAEMGAQRSALYKDTKRLLALAESEEPLTLDLLQCRLLLSIYEINHGATEEAYLSLGICSRAGIVLGLDRHLQQQENDSWFRFEEERRTWWAIIILDRFLRQQRPHWPSAVRDPSSSDILPMDDAEWERRQHNGAGQDSLPPTLRISTPSHIRVGYFGRLAQVSHLLGLVLNNTCNPTPDLNFNAEEAEQLRRTLDIYAELLPREATATECSHYCGVVMMCYSAQLFLMQSKSIVEVDSQTEALTDDMIQMAKELNLELELMGPELLRPLSLFAIYQVARRYLQQFKFTSNEKYADGIRALLQLLGIFDGRWRVAGVYKVEILEELQRLEIHI